MSQWETSWQHQNALVTWTCTYFISEHCVSNAGMCNFVAAFGTRRWFIAAELSLARQLLLRQFDGTWTWARIFAFWRVAKVRYAYFGQWRAGETLCHILELYPWVFARSFNVGRFRDGWNGLSTRLNFVSSSSSLLYVSSSLLFSSLHQYEKEKRKKDIAILF